jgi:hypothetical protein
VRCLIDFSVHWVREIKLAQSKVRVLVNIVLIGAALVGCAEGARITPNPRGEKETVEKGVFAGRVMRSPTCPVGGAGMSCPAEPASGVTLSILSLGGEKIASVVTNDRGAYRVSLPSGTYRAETAPRPGLEFTKDLPATVTITTGQETRLDVTLDTGMR